MARILLVLKDNNGDEWLLPALTGQMATSVQRAEERVVESLADAQPVRVMGLRFVIDEDSAERLPLLKKEWEAIRGGKGY